MYLYFISMLLLSYGNEPVGVVVSKCVIKHTLLIYNRFVKVTLILKWEEKKEGIKSV